MNRGRAELRLGLDAHSASLPRHGPNALPKLELEAGHEPARGGGRQTAYGWPADLSDEQILERLLALNLERAKEEEKAAKVKTPRAQRAKHQDELV